MDRLVTEGILKGNVFYCLCIFPFIYSQIDLDMSSLIFSVSFHSYSLPLGAGSFTVFTISYIYALLILCSMVVFLIPAVLFPRAFNIFSSAFIGSYLIIFAVGMFIFTSLTEIVLRVIKCATVSGYLSTEVNYPFELNGEFV